MYKLYSPFWQRNHGGIVVAKEMTLLISLEDYDAEEIRLPKFRLLLLKFGFVLLLDVLLFALSIVAGCSN
jgi:hypothetical protein